jgi:biotin transport system substrate-specific component
MSNPSSPRAGAGSPQHSPQTAPIRDTSQQDGPARTAADTEARRSMVARRRRSRWTQGDLALIAVFAALLAASVAVPGIPVGAFGVPITLQTLAVTLCGLVLGFGRGTAAVGLYVLLGLVGLPIFSGFRAGPAVLAGPSGGYIVGFVVGAAVIGVLTPLALRRRAKAVWLFGAAVAGLLAIHGCGVLGFLAKGMGPGLAIATDAAYFPGDLLKAILAVVIALSLHRAFPDILRRRRR